MKKSELKQLKEVLEKRREDIMSQSVSMAEPVYRLSQDDLPDEVDLASTESAQNMSIRLRDRERILMRKIEKALRKIEEGEYGICEECEEEIGFRRLMARPVTDLCIRCKEEQERVERSFADDRDH